MKYVLFLLGIVLLLRLGFFYFLPTQLHNNEVIHFQSVLVDDPKMLGSNQEFSLRLGDFWQSSKVLVITNADEAFSYGQTLELTGTVKEKLLKNKQTILTIQNPQIKAKNDGFLPIFGLLRQHIIDFCENNFSQPYSGLAVGIIFGIKSLLTDQITRSFRITGLSHIIAASGMNVTLVAGFLISLLSSFLKRRAAILLSIFGIFFYVLLSGFQASILRAAFMGSIAFSAGLFGRQYSGLYILFLVAVGMLLWDPLLLTDVGFQLSVLATGGILLLTPLATLREQTGQAPSILSSIFLSDDLRTTLAAQIATLPVLLATFGQYSLLSILANLFVLWTIPLIMVIGGVGVVIEIIFEPLGKLIVLCVIPLLWYLDQVTTFFSNHAVLVQIENFPGVFFIGYYLLLSALLLFVKRRKIRT